MTTGPVLAAAIGRVLAEWRRTGYLPPRCEPHPITGAECARIDCDARSHDHDGLPPWTEGEPMNTEEGERARAELGIDGTAGDAQDIPHPFRLADVSACLVCGLSEKHRKHTS